MKNSMLVLIPTRREGTIVQHPKTLSYRMGSVLPDDGSREMNHFVARVEQIGNLNALKTSTLLFNVQTRKIIFAGEINCATEDAKKYGLFKIIGGCRRMCKTYDSTLLGEVCGMDIDDFLYHLKHYKE